MRRFAVPTATVFAVLVSGFVLAGCGGDDDGGGDGGSLAGGEVTVELAESMGSGQTGTAILTAAGEQTDVSIEIGEPVSGSQPAHIHEGTCEGGDLNPTPAFGLQNVTGGVSDTTVDVSLETLTSGTYAINLHMSDADLETYTSCGNIEG